MGRQAKDDLRLSVALPSSDANDWRPVAQELRREFFRQVQSTSYCIGFGGDPFTVLRDVATELGGSFQEEETPSDLVQAFVEIAQRAGTLALAPP